MLFLKFLSSISLSLLFFGNLAAECIDLSGTYSCEGGGMTISRTSDAEGALGYSATIKENGIEKTTSFINFPKGPTPTTVCSEDQIETRFQESGNTTVTLTAILRGEVFTMRLAVELDGTSMTVQEETCHRQ